MKKKKITEADHLEVEWLKEAEKQTLKPSLVFSII